MCTETKDDQRASTPECGTVKAVREELRTEAFGDESLRCSVFELVLLGVSLLNVLAFVGMVLARTWANHSLASTTREFAVPLAPAAWVEARAWAIGAFALLLFLLWPFLPRLSSAARQREVIQLTLPLVLGCTSHAMASFLWAYRLLSLSAIMTTTVSAQLLLVCLTVVRAPLLFRMPFSLWFGWSVYAVLHQGSAALYHEAGIAFFGSAWWSIAALLCLVAIGFLWGSLADNDPCFSAAVALACFAVAQRNQRHHSLPVITYASYLCALLALAHATICLILACRHVSAQCEEDDEDVKPQHEEYDEEAALLHRTSDEGDKERKTYHSAVLSLPADTFPPLAPPMALAMAPGGPHEYGPADPFYADPPGDPVSAHQDSSAPSFHVSLEAPLPRYPPLRDSSQN